MNLNKLVNNAGTGFSARKACFWFSLVLIVFVECLIVYAVFTRQVRDYAFTLFLTVFLVALVVCLIMAWFGFDSPEDHIWFLQEVEKRG